MQELKFKGLFSDLDARESAAQQEKDRELDAAQKLQAEVFFFMLICLCTILQLKTVKMAIFGKEI